MTPAYFFIYIKRNKEEKVTILTEHISDDRTRKVCFHEKRSEFIYYSEVAMEQIGQNLLTLVDGASNIVEVTSSFFMSLWIKHM